MAKGPKYQEINGLRFPLFFDPDIVRYSMEYFPEEDDIIVSSFLKCGASFVSQIVHLILRNGKQLHTADDFFSSIPLLEMMGTENLCYVPHPHCINTYMPLDRIKTVSHAKYIYVARRFTACVISHYKHTKMLPAYFFTEGTFDEFLNLFVHGKTAYCDYYRHFSSGYRRRTCKNVLFITYEFLTANLKDAIVMIAKFLGERYVDNLLKSKEKVLKDILFFSTSLMKFTVEDFWKEMFLDKLISGKCEIYFPIADKYAKLMKQAEKSGHYLTDFSAGINLTAENMMKLDEYLKYYVWEEWYDKSLYQKGKKLNC